MNPTDYGKWTKINAMGGTIMIKGHVSNKLILEYYSEYGSGMRYTFLNNGKVDHKAVEDRCGPHVARWLMDRSGKITPK